MNTYHKHIQHMLTALMQDKQIGTLLSGLEDYDPDTYRHSVNVVYYSALISLADTNFCSKSLLTAALLHDIGKQFLDIRTLNKKGRLSDSEYFYIKSHAAFSYQILHHLNFPMEICLAAGQHHERLDGSGYPWGLTEDSIIPSARIISISDVFDAICSARAYKPANTLSDAFEVLQAAEHFDTHYVNVLFSCFCKQEGKIPSPMFL